MVTDRQQDKTVVPEDLEGLDDEALELDDEGLETAPDGTLYEHRRVVADKGQTLLRVDKFLMEHLRDTSREGASTSTTTPSRATTG